MGRRRVLLGLIVALGLIAMGVATWFTGTDTSTAGAPVQARSGPEEVAPPELGSLPPREERAAIPESVREELEAEPRTEGAGAAEEESPAAPDALLHFRVRGPSGAPIAGAVAVDDDDPDWRSRPTDEDGRGRIENPGGRLDGLRVGAPGYRVQEVDLHHPHASPEQAFEVGLLRETRLVVRVHPPLGSVLEGLLLELRTRPHLFVHEGYLPDPVHRAAGETGFFIAGGGDGGGEYVVYSLKAGQPVLASALATGTPLELSVADSFSGEVHRETLAPLFEGEWREVDVHLLGGPRSFRVRVRSESGEPLEKADVSWKFREDRWRTVSTDTEGVAVFEGLWSSRGTLIVERGGYVPILRTDHPVPEGGQLEIHMIPGREVSVAVTDEAQTPMNCKVWARIEGSGPFHGERVESGRYRFEGLPPGPVEIVARVARREYVARVGALEAEARIEVPVHGRVVVDFPEMDDTHVALIPVGDEEAAFRSWGLGRPAVFRHVLPGEYEVCLQGRLGEEGQEWEDRSPRSHLTVRPAEESRASLVP